MNQNQKEISRHKSYMMSKIMGSQTIAHGIDPENKDPQNLAFTHLLPYSLPKGPDISQGCCISLEVNVPSLSEGNSLFCDLHIALTVFCPPEKLRMEGDEIRTDYLCEELYKLFQNDRTLGRTPAKLLESLEGEAENGCKYRSLTFVIKSGGISYGHA